jgi:hypothetical protein
MQTHLTVGTILLGSLLAAAAGAQSQEDLVARKEAKLAEAWLKKSAWILDYDEAKAAAKKSGKPIFAYFTRSYAP